MKCQFCDNDAVEEHEFGLCCQHFKEIFMTTIHRMEKEGLIEPNEDRTNIRLTAKGRQASKQIDEGINI